MPPIQGFQLFLLTLSVALGIFMNILDTAIANVAIPTIAGDLAVSADEGTWVITSFAVSMGIVLPLTGWLAQRLGEVRLFVFSTFLFTIASVLCGLSTNLTMLIFFRVIQGAVAGPMIPLSQSILIANYPGDKKGLATALWGMVAVVAPVFGPILGGYITDNLSWPWIFYINIPVGIFSIYFTWIILHNRETEIVKHPIDFVGLILLIVGVGCLQVLLDKGKDLDWFHSNEIITLAVISFVSLCLLIVWELTERYPIIDLSLFKIRNFTVGTVGLSIGFMTFFGSVVILPLWLQTQMNYTPTIAGLVVAPLGILPIIVSPIMGRLMNIVDLRILVTFGFLVFAYCSFWIAGFNTQVSFNDIALARFIQGFGAPFFFIAATTILFSGLPNKRLASAAGLSNFLRILGGSFGTSISVTIWARRETLHQSQLVQNLNLYSQTFAEKIQQLQASGMNDKASYAAILKLVINQAFMFATNDVFWLSGFIFLGLSIFMWLARPPFLTKAHLSD